MNEIGNYLLTFLGQFAGGPGPAENNLVRFGLAAILWAVLLAVAWSRQRSQHLPRERLLLLGFGLGLTRELFMLSQITERIMVGTESGLGSGLHQPLEHALTMAAIIAVAGAFLRYALDDERLSRGYLITGAIVTVLALAAAIRVWPRQLAENPQIHFHESWIAWLFHGSLLLFITVAIFYLAKKPGWLPKVVILALSLFFLSEFLILINYGTDKAYSVVLCPVANSFHLLAIPVLGYVYLREQSIEKRRTEEALALYREHLEELVSERTAELETVSAQMREEAELAAALEERHRIAANMHDGLAQVLSYMNLKTDLALDLLENSNGPQALDELHLVQSAIDRASVDVRRSITSLQADPEPRRSLQESLSRIASDFAVDGEPPVEITSYLSAPLYLGQDESEQVLRVIQETIINARRHAQAQRIVVSVHPHKNVMQVTVEDDGRGFRPSALPESGGHFGLSIMQARAAHIGGAVEIDSRPGEGTRVILTWPQNGELPNASERESDSRESPLRVTDPGDASPQEDLLIAAL